MLGLAAGVLGYPMQTERYLAVNASGELRDHSGRLLHAFLTDDEQWCFARDLDAVSPHLIEATLAVEDHRFRTHPGVDPLAVARACWQNLRARRVVSGASTVTMQVVQQADGVPPTLRGKIYETVQAIRLDARLSKNEVLWAYLNTAPYGLNLRGCEAAARRYFGKPAAELTLAEAALLAGLPKAPTSLMPIDHPEEARARRDFVLRRMLAEGYIDKTAFEQAAATTVAAAWHEFPRQAPHVAARLANSIRERNSLRVTLDSNVQALAETTVRRRVHGYGDAITNAAAIIVDTESANVLAWVGSAGFFDTPGGGQVDACRAPRSPGSALKPFTYAVAMESNRLYPCEMLHDGSVDYGLYHPENYDQRYRGLVPASYALKRSLNVPAITVLHRIGGRRLHAFLAQDAGLTTLSRPLDEYGLGLTLGNCEVRLDDLAAAYCMIASLGKYRPLRLHQDRSPSPAKRALSRGACLTLYDMLEHPLPDEPDRSLVRAGDVAPRACWKTGTSTGHRDAWAFVFNRHYVVGVWMGNNDGAASRHLVGARAALPLAARLFRSLPVKSNAAWPEPGDDLHPVTVCAVTGLPASQWCEHTREVLLPKTQYLHRRCAVHGPGADGVSVAERWPGASKQWDLADLSWNTPLPHATHAERTETLRILSPPEQAEYVLTGEPGGDRLRLEASLDRSAPLHWYLNGRYLGRSAPQQPLLLALSPGDHRLACMTDAGALDTVAFAVATPEGAVRFRQ